MAQTVEMNAAESINRDDEEVEKKTKSRRPPSMRILPPSAIAQADVVQTPPFVNSVSRHGSQCTCLNITDEQQG